MIKEKGLKINKIVDLKSPEKGHYLEGLGSVIHDHMNKIIYMTVSNRSSPKMIKQYMSYLPTKHRLI